MADRAYQDQLYAALKEAAESKMAEEKEMEEFRETLHMEETENRLRMQEQAKRRAQEESVRSMIRANELQKKTKEDNKIKAEMRYAVLILNAESNASRITFIEQIMVDLSTSNL